MQSKTQKLPKSEVKIEITVEKQDLNEAKEKALQKISPQIKIAGFRPGKAPLKMIENRVGESVLLEETLEVLISDLYTKALNEHQVFPLTPPEVEIPLLDKLKKEKTQVNNFNQLTSFAQTDFKIIYTVPITPEVNLGNYKKALSEIRGGKKVEVAKTLTEAKRKVEKEKEEQKKRAEKVGQQTPQEQDRELEEKILETLLSYAEFEIPEVLIEHEVNEHLIPQTNAKLEKIGQTLKSYLKIHHNQSLDEFKKELAKEAERVIKLRLIINEIAHQEKLPIEKTGDFGYIITWLKKRVTGNG